MPERAAFAKRQQVRRLPTDEGQGAGSGTRVPDDMMAIYQDELLNLQRELRSGQLSDEQREVALEAVMSLQSLLAPQSAYATPA